MLGPGPLQIKHFGCLTVIAAEGPISQQSLGSRMRVDRTTMVTVVDDLQAAKLVERRRNPDDRRAYALEVTNAGRAWIEEKRGELRAAQKEHLLERLLVSQATELVADPAVEVRAR